MKKYFPFLLFVAASISLPAMARLSADCRKVVDELKEIEIDLKAKEQAHFQKAKVGGEKISLRVAFEAGCPQAYYQWEIASHLEAIKYNEEKIVSDGKVLAGWKEKINGPRFLAAFWAEYDYWAQSYQGIKRVFTVPGSGGLETVLHYTPGLGRAATLNGALAYVQSNIDEMSREIPQIKAKIEKLRAAQAAVQLMTKAEFTEQEAQAREEHRLSAEVVRAALRNQIGFIKNQTACSSEEKEEISKNDINPIGYAEFDYLIETKTSELSRINNNLEMDQYGQLVSRYGCSVSR